MNFVDARKVIVKTYGEPPQGAKFIASYGNKTFSVIDDDNLTVNSLIEDTEMFLQNETIDTSQKFKTNLWGLDQLDHVVDGKYNNYGQFGANSIVYVIDSGISPHSEFGKLSGKAFGGIKDWKDCDGHGTHVASTIAGKKYGVAKKAKLVSARVFDCSGSTATSVVIEAIYWVITQPKGIVNMSLGGNKNQFLNEAVKDLKDAGFVVVVAAGNSANDACFYSPSSSMHALTVGCFGFNKIICSFSNRGRCVDLFAPGLDIIGARIPKGSRFLSGTSMSSPHVAGIAALVKSKNPNFSVDQIYEKILSISAVNTLNIDVDSPNLSARVDNFLTRSPTTQPTQSPTVTPPKKICWKIKFKSKCTGYCKWTNGVCRKN